VVVTVRSVGSNAATFTVVTTAPSIASLTPASAAVGTAVTIAGGNFGRRKAAAA
jgi:hypothetical protein